MQVVLVGLRLKTKTGMRGNGPSKFSVKKKTTTTKQRTIKYTIYIKAYVSNYISIATTCYQIEMRLLRYVSFYSRKNHCKYYYALLLCTEFEQKRT